MARIDKETKQFLEDEGLSSDSKAIVWCAMMRGATIATQLEKELAGTWKYKL